MFRKLTGLIRGEAGFVFVGGSDLIAAAIGALFWFYSASLLQVEEYGHVSYLISTSSLTFTLASFGMGQTLLTFLSKKTIEFLYQVKSIIFVTAVAAALIIGTITQDYIVSILVIASSFYSLSTMELMAKKKHKEYLFVGVGGKIVQVGLSILLYLLFGVYGFIMGYAVAYLVFSYRFVAGLRGFKLKFEELKATWKFSFYNYTSDIVSDLKFHYDKVMISVIFGFYLLGSYQFVFQLFSVLSILTGSFFRYLLPYESEGIVKRKFKIISIIFTVVLVAAAFFIGPFLISSLYPKFTHVIEAFQIASLATIPQILSVLIRVKILSENKHTRHILYSGIIGSMSYLALVFSLGTSIGINGMAVALMISSLAGFSYLAVVVRGKII